MGDVGEALGLTVAQVAVAYCVAKGVVPVCGCRKPYQVVQLAQAARARLSEGEVARLERAADETGVRILTSDMFRFAVRDEDRRRREARAALGAALAVAGVAALVALAMGARRGRA